jgi:F0F1-type ATP synthase membrane subunit c/vacuolar-type H+-ATPase subunit K
MENNNLSSESIYKNLLIIWFGLFNSQIIFLVIIYFIKPELYTFNFSQPLLGENSPLVLILAFIGITNIIISFVLRKNFLTKAIDQQNPSLVQTAMVVGCALCESVSIFGLFLVFLSGYQYFFIFIALGMAGMLLHLPRRENLHLASYKKSQKF